MDTFRENDTILWLHNKLGSNNAWTDSSFSNYLNSEILTAIKNCFVDLDSKVKLKLLLSFFYIPHPKWSRELEAILCLAVTDEDQWVSMIADIMRTLPSNGTICTNLETEQNRDILTSFVNGLKLNIETNKTPLEWCYLNKTALECIAEPKTPDVKHFNLKRQPKSESLKRSLLEKSERSAAKNLKNWLGMKVKRKLGTSSSHGFNLRLTSVTSNLARSVARKDRIKLLDFHEQPAAKRSKLTRLEVTDLVATTSDLPEYAAGLGL